MKKLALLILGLAVLVMGIMALIPGIDMGAEPVWHSWVKVAIGAVAVAISLMKD